MAARRRRLAWWILAVLFVGVPLIEIYLLVQLGQVIGAWWTIVVLLADGLLGSWLVRREGGRAWRALSAAISSGRMPSTELADGALVLVGGTLLVTPGFLSDVVGLACILPLTRPVARRALARVIARRLSVHTVPPRGTAGGFGYGPASAAGPGPAPRPRDDAPRTAPRPGHHEVVRGEVVD